MEIYKDIEIVDLALKYKDILIIGDVQLGYEEYMNQKGILLPRFNLDEIIKRLDTIFSKVTVNTIVVNGDIKHEFGNILRQEWKDTLRFIDYLASKVNNIILIKGNHDIILGPIANKRNMEIKDHYQIDDITILHGHRIIPNLSKVIIIGHEHPAVSFKERKNEKYKCFLKGRHKDKVLIVMPSFNFLTEGSDVTRGKRLSPFLKGNLDDFEVYVVEDKVYFFGRIKDIIKP